MANQGYYIDYGYGPGSSDGGHGRALQQQYKDHNQDYGKAVAGLAMNAPQLITPKAPLAAYRAVRCAVKIRDSRKSREAIEMQAAQQGFDIQEGPRKRHIFKGLVKGAVRSIL